MLTGPSTLELYVTGSVSCLKPFCQTLLKSNWFIEEIVEFIVFRLTFWIHVLLYGVKQELIRSLIGFFLWSSNFHLKTILLCRICFHPILRHSYTRWWIKRFQSFSPFNLLHQTFSYFLKRPRRFLELLFILNTAHSRFVLFHRTLFFWFLLFLYFVKFMKTGHIWFSRETLFSFYWSSFSLLFHTCFLRFFMFLLSFFLYSFKIHFDHLVKFTDSSFIFLVSIFEISTVFFFGIRNGFIWFIFFVIKVAYVEILH